jgi:hypothetical protein
LSYQLPISQVWSKPGIPPSPKVHVPQTSLLVRCSLVSSRSLGDTGPSGWPFLLNQPEGLALDGRTVLGATFRKVLQNTPAGFQTQRTQDLGNGMLLPAMVCSSQHSTMPVIHWIKRTQLGLVKTLAKGCNSAIHASQSCIASSMILSPVSQPCSVYRNQTGCPGGSVMTNLNPGNYGIKQQRKESAGRGW